MQKTSSLLWFYTYITNKKLKQKFKGLKKKNAKFFLVFSYTQELIHILSHYKVYLREFMKLTWIDFLQDMIKWYLNQMPLCQEG